MRLVAVHNAGLGFTGSRPHSAGGDKVGDFATLGARAYGLQVGRLSRWHTMNLHILHEYILARDDEAAIRKGNGRFEVRRMD